MIAKKFQIQISKLKTANNKNVESTTTYTQNPPISSPNLQLFYSNNNNISAIKTNKMLTIFFFKIYPLLQ